MVWTKGKCLIWNIKKTKEMAVDTRRKRNKPNTISIMGDKMEVLEENTVFIWTTGWTLEAPMKDRADFTS